MSTSTLIILLTQERLARLRLSWSPPRAPGGPVAFYRIDLTSSARGGGNSSTVKEVPAETRQERCRMKKSFDRIEKAKLCTFASKCRSFLSTSLVHGEEYEASVLAVTERGVQGKEEAPNA